MNVKAWAVVDRDKIVVETVYPTRRGAIVNWLGVVARVTITARMDDEFIEHLWLLARGSNLLNVDAVEVTITVNEPALSPGTIPQKQEPLTVDEQAYLKDYLETHPGVSLLHEPESVSEIPAYVVGDDDDEIPF